MFKKKRKFKNRFLGLTLLTLSLASLVSFGYSTWLISSRENIKTNIETSIGEVKETSPILKDINVTPFTLTRDGFLVDETIVNKTSIHVTFVVDNVEALKNGYIDQNNTINLVATFNCDNDVFLNCIKEPSLVLIQGEVGVNTSSSRNHVNQIKIQIDKNSNVTKVELLYVIEGDGSPYFNKVPKMNIEIEARR